MDGVTEVKEGRCDHQKEPNARKNKRDQIFHVSMYLPLLGKHGEPPKVLIFVNSAKARVSNHEKCSIQKRTLQKFGHLPMFILKSCRMTNFFWIGR